MTDQFVQNNASGIGNDNQIVERPEHAAMPSGGLRHRHSRTERRMDRQHFGGHMQKRLHRRNQHRHKRRDTNSTNPITCNTGASEAIAGFNWKSEGALEQLQGICRPLTGGSGRTVGTTATATARWNSVIADRCAGQPMQALLSRHCTCRCVRNSRRETFRGGC